MNTLNYHIITPCMVGLSFSLQLLNTYKNILPYTLFILHCVDIFAVVVDVVTICNRMSFCCMVTERVDAKTGSTTKCVYHQQLLETLAHDYRSYSGSHTLTFSLMHTIVHILWENINGTKMVHGARSAYFINKTKAAKIKNIKYFRQRLKIVLLLNDITKLTPNFSALVFCIFMLNQKKKNWIGLDMTNQKMNLEITIRRGSTEAIKIISLKWYF